MQLFFSGWKRKFGIVALMLGCVFVIGWLRSPYQQDTISLHLLRPLCLKLVSVSNRLIVSVLRINTNQAIATSVWSSTKANARSWTCEFAGVKSIHLTREHLFSADDFDFGVGYSGQDLIDTEISQRSYQLPYWSIVLPLTTLSAWLLLSTSGGKQTDRRRKESIIHGDRTEQVT